MGSCFPRVCGAQSVGPSPALGELLDGGVNGGADVALDRPPWQAHLCSRPRSGQVRKRTKKKNQKTLHFISDLFD